MARGNADVLFKKNSKLESFLKRTLPEEAFERVRGYEACIIVTEKENKGFKYCVLDDEYIYQAENPPKSREDLQVMVPLKEIISVDLVGLIMSTKGIFILLYFLYTQLNTHRVVGFNKRAAFKPWLAYCKNKYGLSKKWDITLYLIL